MSLSQQLPVVPQPHTPTLRGSWKLRAPPVPAPPGLGLPMAGCPGPGRLHHLLLPVVEAHAALLHHQRLPQLQQPAAPAEPIHGGQNSLPLPRGACRGSAQAENRASGAALHIAPPNGALRRGRHFRRAVAQLPLAAAWAAAAILGRRREGRAAIGAFKPRGGRFKRRGGHGGTASPQPQGRARLPR